MAVGSLYPSCSNQDPGAILLHSIINITIGFLIGPCITIAELAWFQTKGKRMQFLPYLLLQTGFYVVVINASVIGVSAVHQALFHGTGLAETFASEQIRDLMYGRAFLKVNAYSLAMIFFINFVRQVNRMLGQNALKNFLTGKYHKPVEENRVFMFLDLKSSTQIAEKLKNKALPRVPERFLSTSPRPSWKAGAKSTSMRATRWWHSGETGERFRRRIIVIDRHTWRAYRTMSGNTGSSPSSRPGSITAGGDGRRETRRRLPRGHRQHRIEDTHRATVNKNLLLSGEPLRNISLSGSLTPERMGRIRLKGKEKEINSIRWRKRRDDESWHSKGTCGWTKHPHGSQPETIDGPSADDLGNWIHPVPCTLTPPTPSFSFALLPQCWVASRRAMKSHADQ